MIDKLKNWHSALVVMGFVLVIFLSFRDEVFASDITGTIIAEELAQQTVILSQILTRQVGIATQLDGLLKSVKTYYNLSFHDVTEELKAYHEAAHEGQAISYAMQNLDTKFKETYKGYQPPDDFQNEYKNWAGATMDTLIASLDSAQKQKEEFSHEKDYYRQWQNRSNNAQGQTQALQVTNMIALELATQLQKLRQLVMLQIQSQNAYMAAQMQKDSAVEAAAKNSIYLLNDSEDHRGYK
ncbi:MAG: hypothetical protein HQL26_02890 [Candidatus Omnitrophica bacterium]|nr:hypothetical protein [Candidatus Omnitrophota bacterium]